MPDPAPPTGGSPEPPVDVTDFNAEDPALQPSVPQAAYVISHLLQHAREGGSYRYLIYDRLGYGPEAYAPLLAAGALEFSNLCPIKESEPRTGLARMLLGGRVTAVRQDSRPDTYRVVLDLPGTYGYPACWRATRPPVVGELVVWVYEVGNGYGMPVAYPVDAPATYDCYDPPGCHPRPAKPAEPEAPPAPPPAAADA